MASTHLTRTPATGQTSRYKGTLSVWLKRAKTDEEDFIFYGLEGSANRMKIDFLPSGKLQINSIQAGSNNLVYETNRLFRDTSAWYHIVIAIDTTLGTAGDRCRLYVNGIEETSFSTETHFSQNALHFFTENNIPIYIGSQATGNYYDGCMSHYHLIDGTQYQASDFGSTDSTTGEWKINTSPSVTYGTNGFFILKDGNSVTDQSPNTNNFTVAGGTLTNTEDSPSNVFATLNPLLPNAETFSNGNTTYTNGSGANWRISGTTLAPTSGKYYCEIKITENGGATQVGLMDMNNLPSSLATDIGSGNWNWSYYSVSGNKRHDDISTSYGDSFTTGDIIGIAMDLDNLKLYFSKNGVWQNSGVPTSGATGTGSAFDLDSGASYAFAIASNDTGTNPVQDFNFGNGYFGTTAVASAGTNASGNGIFEYNVPAGFTALSTKGLNL